VNRQLNRRLSSHISAKSTIAVVGGDGTVSSVADLMAHTQAVLAPLPGGTLNHFATDLGIPSDMGEAIMRLATAKRHKIDTASVNNVTFINNSSIGLYPASLQARQRFEDRFGKWIAAIIGGFRALARFRVYQLTIKNKSMSTPFVFVGNNSYRLDDFGVADRARLNGGALSVYVARASSRRQLFVIFLHALTGRLHAADDFESFSIRDQLVIESTRRNVSVSHDGEVEHLSGHLTYEIHPKSLWVL
jgi:diacylglycerol kinase family enzyme